MNPEYIADALRDAFGVLTDEKVATEYYTIMRNRAYKADMSEFR